VWAARGADSYRTWKQIVAFLQIFRICSPILGSVRTQHNLELSATRPFAINNVPHSA
jgi:hypothetical protein